MKYIINKNTDTPAYLQLYEHIKYDIVEGIYSYGSKLPSKRVLAAETGVSIITTGHAYDLLCDEGYVESRLRSGYYVIFRTEDGFVTSSTIKSEHIQTDEDSDQTHLPFSVLTKTMRRVMNDYGEYILNKSPNEGCLELREAIRMHLARNRGIYVDASQIIIGSGAEYLYNIVVGILGTECIYAIEYPSYEKIEQVYSLSGIHLERLSLGNDGIDSKALSDSSASVLHISPYRSFPTGITASASKRYEYIRWATDGKYIVEDDFESEFTVSTKPEETLFSMSDSENIIYINTFSKTISPSIRTGYMVLPKKLLSVYKNNTGFLSCAVPTFEQYVIAELINHGDFERHINRIRRKKRQQINS